MSGQTPSPRDLKTLGRIEGGRPTIASRFRRDAVQTAMVGNWHLGFDIGLLDLVLDAYLQIPAPLDIYPGGERCSRYPSRCRFREPAGGRRHA